MKYTSSADILAHIVRATSELEQAPRSAWDSLDPDRILKNIYALEDCARAAGTDASVITNVLHDPLFPALAKRSRAVYGTWEKRDEDFHAHHLLTQARDTSAGRPEDIIRYIRTDAVHPNDTSLKQTASFAFQEGTALGLDSRSKVAFVGSGPFPESAISIALDFGCTVTGIDSDAASNETAQELIDRFGMSNKIHLVHARGQEHSYERYTHVYVAVLVSEKAAIVRRIFETNPEARVTCRTVRDLRTIIYEPLESLPEEIAVERTIIGDDPKTIMHSVILAGADNKK